MRTILAVVVGAMAAVEAPRMPAHCWIVDDIRPEVVKARPDTPAFALLTRTPLGSPVWSGDGRGGGSTRATFTFYVGWIGGQ
ncbi:MAG: hypothetical protein MUF18_12970 [Fimbriiglobus sp.]|jgi:hypothetical protein|nr:hypothetical protein [Fimbriiglobus sp.]